MYELDSPSKFGPASGTRTANDVRCASAACVRTLSTALLPLDYPAAGGALVKAMVADY
jgi:hypothetical protein